MAQQIILRKGAAAAWTLANPTLAAGEPGVETDTGKFKLGNGVTAWVSLAYAVGTIPTDVGQLADVGNLIPTNLADLADVSSTAPSTGQVLKWDGLQWLPSADATGGDGGGATTLDELTDVSIIGTPAANSILKYVGGVWGAGAETSQTLSSATSGSGVNITLSNTGGTVKFAPGTSNNVTVTKVGEEVEIDSDDTSYTTSVTEGPSLEPRITLAKNVNNVATGDSTDISLLGLGQVTTTKTGAQTIGISAVNTTYSLSQQSTTGGASTVISGTAEATALAATLVSGSAVVTLTAGSTKGLRPGLSIAKTSGVGIFGASAKILTVDSLTQLTLTVVHSGAGAVVFSATSVMQFNIVSPVGTGGLSITTDGSNTISISNTNGRVTTGTLNRLAMYSDNENLTTVGQTNDGISFDPTTKWTTMTSGRLALNNHDLVFTRQNIGTGTRNEGLLYQVFYDQAATTAWNWTRGRGAQQTPTPAQIGDELFNWRFYGQWGTTTADLAMAARIFGTVTNNVTTNRVGATITFSTSNGTSAAAARVKITADGYLQADTLQALTTNGDLNIITNGTGYIRLPLNTTVGGVPVGSVALKGTRTDVQLTALTGMVTGDAYVCSSTGGAFIAQHIYLYDGAAWNDLGSFQGPAGVDGTDGIDGIDGTNGQGVPTGGTTGQVLSKINSTNYNTQWSTITLPTDISDLTDTTNIIPADISDLTDTTSVIPTTLTDLGIVDGTVGQVLTTNGAGAFTFSTVTSGSGDVVGPATATGNALARYDLTTGKLLKNSLVTVSDTGVITAPSVGSVIPFYFADQAAFPSATTYHGAIAHSHADGKMYFAHSGTWNALANASEIVADTNTTYGISAETVTGGVNLRLTGSDTTTDNVKLTAGTNITLTRTSADEITIDAAGGGASALDDLSDVVITGTPTNGQVLKYDSGTSKWINGTDSTGGGSLPTRAILSAASGSLADGAVGPINITGYKSYMLMKVETSAAAWVRIYISEAARIADASRLEGTDPTPGSGVIAEVITTGAQTVLISPSVLGFNNENPVTTNIPIRVTNKSGGTAAITVTLTALQLEA